MNRTLFTILILLSSSMSSAWAYRVIEQTEDAHELVLGEVALPLGVTGSVIFKLCEDCTTTSLRVTSATSYFVNGAALELKDFLESAEAIRQTNGGNQNTAVYVFFDLESQRVNRLALDHFSR